MPASRRAASPKPVGRRPRRPSASINKPSVAKETPAENGEERLHKRIARSGLASRRAAEEMIAAGRVEVNGVTITEMGVKVLPEDEVRVDGRAIDTPKLFYVAMNKPTGYVTTMSDPMNRPTVAKLLPKLGVTLKPVGRLDMDTEGLLIFTNDGEFAHRLAHPRYMIEKEYIAVVQGQPDEKSLERLRKGIYLADEVAERHGRPTGRKTAPAQVYFVSEAGKEQSRLRFVLHEGRKRQVRLMCDAIGHPVASLKRVRIGSLYLNKMRKGECRMLGMEEADALKRELGL